MSFVKHPPILYFHSIAPQKNRNWIRSYLTLEIQYFEDLLKYIKKKKLKTFFISEMDDDDYNLNNSIGLSFDDGYLDNWVYVFPLLKKYGMKATIFCLPHYIDFRENKRPNMDDVWLNNVKNNELKSWGFLSPVELIEMEKSGLVDIQSHTLSHDKIPISDKIIGFNSPVSPNINYYLLNNPEIKPYYINKSFTDEVPYGFPIFEEASAIMSPRIWINEEYITLITEKLSKHDWSSYKFSKTFQHIAPIVESCTAKGNIIQHRESEESYKRRVKAEIIKSKNQLESILNKKISVICWPNGDFNQLSINYARESGYSKIHFVPAKADGLTQSEENFIRIGRTNVLNNRFLTKVRFKFVINEYCEIKPYPRIAKFYRSLKELR